MELIAVVLGCESSADRFAACRQMLDQGFAGYALVAPKLEEGVCVPVKMGKEKYVQVVPGEDKAILVEKSQKSSVTTEAELWESVEAPVSKGQRLGTLTVRSGEQVLAQIPLVAAQPVLRLSWGDVFLTMLRKLCLG